MADDTNIPLLVGQLQGGFREIKQMLVDQNLQHGRDKEEAISDRDRRHEENKTEIRRLSESIDGTAVIARDNKSWIETVGKSLTTRVDNIHERVTALEDHNTEARGEAKGSAGTWAWIIGAIGAAGGAIVSIIEYGPAAFELIKAKIHGG